MKSNLLVITGAGASAGCSVPGTKTNVHYSPPLTAEIFTREGYGRDLRNDRYRQVQNVGISFRDSGGNLEEFLSNLKEQAKTERILKRQFNQTIIYLKDLFLECSNKYTANYENAYNILVNIIFNNRKKFNKIIFVTVNYDLFLENSFQKLLGVTFSDLNQYLKFFEKWSYIKFHGSASWGKRIESSEALTQFNKNLVKAIDHDVDFVLKDQIEFSLGKDPAPSFAWFPHLAAPLGKYKPFCPQEHIKELESFLELENINLLSIGFSGLDQDLMELLKRKKENYKKIWVVSRNKNSAKKIGDRFGNKALPLEEDFKSLVWNEVGRSKLATLLT